MSTVEHLFDMKITDAGQVTVTMDPQTLVDVRVALQEALFGTVVSLPLGKRRDNIDNVWTAIHRFCRQHEHEMGGTH